MTIKVYERSIRAQTCATLVKQRLGNRYSSCIILPVPTSRDGFLLTGTDVTLEDGLALADSGTLVVGYGIPKEARSRLLEVGATVVDASEDEEFLAKNAELTAECALGIILTTEKSALRDLSVGIVGYGRIGKCLLRLLLFLGSSVTVFTGREEVRLELGECGIKTAEYGAVDALSRLDILINTAPARLFDTTGDGFPEGLRVIELASGSNFEGLDTVERYPSVPARMLPRSAGRALYNAVERALGVGGDL